MRKRYPNAFCPPQSIIAIGCLLSSAAFVDSAPQNAIPKPPTSPPTQTTPTQTTPAGQRKSSAASDPDYSKEGAVIQEWSTTIKFSSDGSSQSVETAVVRVQSDAGVRQFGVLSFAYDRDNQKLQLAYLRVRKQDGRVIATADDAIQDVSSEISKAAPTYSDLRQRQIPVKALGVGDVIEYQLRRTQFKSEIPGHFWYAQNFITDAVALKETLEIAVPSDKYVKVASPALKAEVREEPGRKIYTWRTAQLAPTSAEADKSRKGAPQPFAAVQVSTFKSWDEVGRWYSGLQNPRVVVTPVIQAKADELTKGLSTEAEKTRAIYDFVSTKFRYVSLSFGVGRYQPHPADEVLANQYGDCKDKHTLFAALLKAAGTEALPVLIGAGIKLDPEVPSPAQFNHLITAIPNPNGQGYSWLDTTPEVAPYELLQSFLRDQKALLIPTNAPAILVTTPADPPFPASEVLNVEAVLDANGTLTSHFDLMAHGDDELLFRSAFHAVPPARWLDLVQQMVRAEGFAGTVSNLDVTGPEALAKPFHYSFDYTRPNYSDWENHRISPPLFPMLLALSDDAEKPVEPFFFGAHGEINYRATVTLPKGYSAELPSGEKSQADFAEYQSSYVQKDGVLTVFRRLLIKQAKIQVPAWDAYRKFAKQVSDDHTQVIQLKDLSASAPAAEEDNSEANAFVSQAYDAERRQDMNAAREYLSQAEKLNSTQRGLWATYGIYYIMSKQHQKGMEALQKEIRLHPNNTFAYQALAQTQDGDHRPTEALETLTSGLKVMPADVQIAAQLAHLLLKQKRYRDVPGILQPVLEKNNDPALQGALGQALLRSGRREEGEAAFEKYVKSGDATALNNAAFALADTETDLPLAKAYAEQAISKLEDESSKLSLPSPKDADFFLMNSLSNAWDTLGWVYFQTGDVAQAERYVAAAWDFSQRGAVGDHLGQIYLKQGKKESAIHTWQLAVAADPSLDETRDRLRTLGALPVPAAPPRTKGAKPFVFPAEELGKLRVTDVPALPKQVGSAEFFVLFASGKIEDTQFISGGESLKEAGSALRAIDFHVPAPNSNTGKILRRGILSCSTYTAPSCQFVMLLPATSRSAPSGAQPGLQSASGVQPPSLPTRAEPQYSEAAIQAKVEGVVRLGIVVDENGVPQNITVVQSLGFELDEKAKDCVSQWRFKPATKEGKPVSSPANVEVNFRLVNDSPK